MKKNGRNRKEAAAMKLPFVSGETVEIHQTEWGTLQWLANGPAGICESMTIGRVTFKPRMANPHHMHPNCDEALYVVRGIIEHTVKDGNPVVLHPGDLIVVPQGIWHHATNLTDEEAEVIVTFNSAYRQTIGEINEQTGVDSR